MAGTPDTPRPRYGRRIAVVIAVFVLAALVVPVFAMLQPRYYERYPSLDARMDNWRASTHAKVPCSGCHVDPGPLGFARFSVKAIPAFYSQLILGPKSQNLFEVPDQQACRKCHTTYRRVSSNGDLLIPHRAHVVVLKLNCAVCHQNLVHSKNTRGYNKPEMRMCLATCHDGTKASNKCVDCHTRKQVPDGHRSKDWLETHSAMAEKVDCGRCHAFTPDYCSDCHAKRPASHKANWKQGHAAAAKARGTKGCLVCHGGARFCKECHD
ncbi:MAG: hypothetical protein FDZ75_00245 [Actinobacteria bacterium]|nr:MAG: hypothetical protein FDZ75_00245 [Actinomycetota bacterium]